MGLYGFYLINFCVSFISDVVLNDLAKLDENSIFSTKIIRSLRPYFKDKLITISGIYAALTVIIALAILSLISKYILGFYYPKNLVQLLKFLALAYPVGHLADIAIDKLKIFGNTLDDYYKEAGAGMWGAIAFIFSIVISYILEKYLLPYL